MELALLAGLIATPLLGQVISWIQAGNVASVMGFVVHKEYDMLPGSHPDTVALAISEFFKDCIVSVLLWQFYNVFRDIRRGEVFSQRQIKRVSVSGWCFIVLTVYSIACDLILSLLQSPDDNLQYYIQIDNLIYLLTGVGLVILSYVLQLATDLKEEQELVI